MEHLTLPEPAGSLWASKRHIIHAIPPEMFRSTIPPHLGGGTILAARWQHRLSTDIDVLLPGRNSLIDVLQDNDRNIVKQLGGTPEAVAGARVKVAFEHGSIDLSTFRPDPPYGQREAAVDHHLEQVLSNTQILHGKLQRVDQMLVRDVFDILTAADEDPAALATAASMVSKQSTAAIESAWRNAAGTLARRFDDAIQGSERTNGATLGRDAARAFRDHRYTRLQIDIDDNRVTIRKTAAIGALEPESYDAADPGRALMQSGVGSHLNNNGPVTAPQVLGAIRTAIDAGGRNQTVFDTASRENIAQINAMAHIATPPAPAPPPRPRAQTHDGYER